MLKQMKLTIATTDYYHFPEEDATLELNSDLEKLFIEAQETYKDLPDGSNPNRDLAEAVQAHMGESVRIKVSDQGQAVVFRPEEEKLLLLSIKMPSLSSLK